MIALISNPAALLAMVRACGGVTMTKTDERTLRLAANAAELAGRVLVDCTIRSDGAPSRGVNLGWAAQTTPSPEDALTYKVRVLPPLARLTWACCLGLAWPDRTADPYPGSAFTRSSVIDTAADLGASAIWVKSALVNDLRPAGLICEARESGQSVLRLGPAAAAMPDSFVQAIRRFHERLPRPESMEP